MQPQPKELDLPAPTICDAEFTWHSRADNNGALAGNRNFSLRVKGGIRFIPGKINLITGPTGSGKTSLLMALLGNSYTSVLFWLY